jgi:hypothetical protein
MIIYKLAQSGNIIIFITYNMILLTYNNEKRMDSRLRGNDVKGNHSLFFVLFLI